MGFHWTVFLPRVFLPRMCPRGLFGRKSTPKTLMCVYFLLSNLLSWRRMGLPHWLKVPETPTTFSRPVAGH